MYKQDQGNLSSSSISTSSTVDEEAERTLATKRRRQALSLLAGSNGLGSPTLGSGGLATLHATLSTSLHPRPQYLQDANILAALGAEASAATNGRAVDGGSDTSEDSVLNAIKHGFGEDESILAAEDGVQSPWPYWSELRLDPPGANSAQSAMPEWRNKDRLKTFAAALVVCLRIGYDPPDIVKTDPCAKLECWVDPYSLPKDKALETIGANLQKQYESLAPTGKTRYRQYLDPSVEDTRKLALAMRKMAKHERVLFHYNGHGVPKPTASGEIWVFNKQYTQYIPVSLKELLVWLGSPTIFVWDCSAAGNIVQRIEHFAKERDDELAAAANAVPPPAPPAAGLSGASIQHAEQVAPTAPFRDTIQLAACSANQSLPMHPELPADLFTACLTSPIEMALRFFILRNPLKSDLDPELPIKIPGRLNDRKSALGELSWIFTAVTDTIAWNTLPPALFQRLFRHDLVVAALFRGFLLAQRIMRYYDCTPTSVPALPPTHNHPLWASWDLAVDRCLNQLGPILATNRAREEADAAGLPKPPEITFTLSRFFAHQLTAFEKWLDQAGQNGGRQLDLAAPRPLAASGTYRPISPHPEQLPIVLQVLLSQAHRLRALILLCKFLDLGPWAVHLALSIGIFPYVLKLLQAPSADLKPVLIFIWARILGVFRGCQEDLIKQVPAAVPNRPIELPFHYFVKVLNPSMSAPTALPIPNVSEHRAMCAFILSILCRDFQPGQEACLQEGVNVLDMCLQLVDDDDPLLRQWSTLCLAQLWSDYDEGRGLAVRRKAHSVLTDRLMDPVPEIRAATCYALGTLVGTSGGEAASSDGTLSPPRKISTPRALSSCSPFRTGLTNHEQQDIEGGVAMAALPLVSDASPLVRREVVVLLSALVAGHPDVFVVAAFQHAEEERVRLSNGGERPAQVVEERQQQIEEALRQATEHATPDGAWSPQFKAMINLCVYKTLLDLASDPCKIVADKASTVVDFIHDRLLSSPLADVSASIAAVRESLATVTPAVGSSSSREASTASPQLNGSGRSASGSWSRKTAKNLGLIDSRGGARTAAPSPTDEQPPASVSRQLRHTSSADSLLHARDRRTRMTNQHDIDPADIQDIEETLYEADEERMRRLQGGRSAVSTPDSSDDGQLSGPEPEEYGLPLRSEYFDSCCRYFAEPQMRQPEDQEPGSLAFNARIFRRERIDQIVAATGPLRFDAAKTAWDTQYSSWHLERAPVQLLFHPYDKQLISADERGFIAVHDWQRDVRLNRFHSEGGEVLLRGGNLSSHRITSMHLINETESPFLLTGSSDGVIRLFKKFDTPTEMETVTAFRALNDLVKSTKLESGLVSEWQQGRGQLIVSGNVKSIRVWDAVKDQLAQDFPTRSNSCLTSLTSEQSIGDLLVAGFGDGVLRVYDRRLPPRDTMTRQYRLFHQAWIEDVRLQPGGTRELTSTCVAGDVATWDLRMEDPLRLWQAHSDGLIASAVHDQAPVFATGSTHQIVKVWSMNSTELEPINRFRHGVRGSGHQHADISTMAMHPHYHLLAVGSSDGQVSTYRNESNKSLVF